MHERSYIPALDTCLGMHVKGRRKPTQGVAGRPPLCRSALDGGHVSPTFLWTLLIISGRQLGMVSCEIGSVEHACGPFNPWVFLSTAVDQTDMGLRARINLRCVSSPLDR